MRCRDRRPPRRGARARGSGRGGGPVSAQAGSAVVVRVPHEASATPRWVDIVGPQRGRPPRPRRGDRGYLSGSLLAVAPGSPTTQLDTWAPAVGDRPVRPALSRKNSALSSRSLALIRTFTGDNRITWLLVDTSTGQSWMLDLLGPGCGGRRMAATTRSRMTAPGCAGRGASGGLCARLRCHPVGGDP